MALLGGLTARTIEELRSVSGNQDVTQIEARVGALYSLMQQAATRLCPAAAAAAADAALSLLSSLQAARLRLHAGAPAAAALERSTQALLQVLQQGLAPPTPALLPPGAAAAAPQPTTDGGSRRAELASLVRGLGFNSHDWQAAQSDLSQRTAAALGGTQPSDGPSGNTAAATAAASTTLSEPASPAPLDSLLRTAVSSPAWQPGSGESSLLHGTMAELLWVLRQFPSPADLPPERQPQLSPEGWAAYWVLEPRALQQALAKILQAATHQPAVGQQQAAGAKRHPLANGALGSGSSSCPADLQPLLDSKPHWAAIPAAVAQHPALHLLARRTLNSWLAASGNPAAWHLLLHLVRATCGGSGAAQLLQQGRLPAQLSVLYPPGLAAAAALLHTQSPSEAGLCQVVGLLQRFLAGGASAAAGSTEAQAEPAAGAAAAAAAQHSLAGDPAAWAADAAERQQQVWQLQLDAPSWLLFCLQQLPLQQLLDLAAQQAGEGSGPGRRAAGPPTPQGAAAERAPHMHHLPGSQGPEGSQPQAQQLLPTHAAASPAAACYAALALWHGEPLTQAVLKEALQLQLADVDLAAVAPWLQALHGWQAMLAAAVPGEAEGAGGTAATAAQQEPPTAEQAAADMEVEADNDCFSP